MPQISQAREQEATIFQAGITQLDRHIPDLADVSARYEFNKRCRGVFDLVSRNAPANTSEAVITENTIRNLSEPLSYLAIYDTLHRAGLLRREGVTKVLDLGCGYWNSALAYDLLWRDLNCCIGIEMETRKASYSKYSALPAFGVSTDRFELRTGNFFDFHSEALWANADNLDYALLQSFHTGGTDAQKNIGALFAELQKRLGRDGSVIVIIDRRDIDTYKYSASVEMQKICRGLTGCQELGVKRMTPKGSFDMMHSLEASCWIIPKWSLG